MWRKLNPMFIANSFLRVLKDMLIVLWRISKVVLLIYMLMHLRSVVSLLIIYLSHALSLPLHHCSHCYCHCHFHTIHHSCYDIVPFSLVHILHWHCQTLQGLFLLTYTTLIPIHVSNPHVVKEWLFSIQIPCDSPFPIVIFPIAPWHICDTSDIGAYTKLLFSP